MVVVLSLMLALIGSMWVLIAGAFWITGLRQQWRVTDVLWIPFVFGSVALVVMSLVTWVALLVGLP